MALFPVLGDEAYYFYWGMHPAGGYYDLPPMIGWWLAPLVKVSLNPFWLRLPNLITWGILSFSISEWLAHGMEKSRANLIATSFALMPLPFLAVLMFPDIPLLFFSYFSAYLFFNAVNARQKSPWSFLFSGALIGAAVLSKYFAVFLFPAYFIWFFRRPREQKNNWGMVWFIVGGLPFALQHFLWNEKHCWSNFVFNFVTRQAINDGPLYQVLGLFLLSLLLVSFPFLKTACLGKLKIELKAPEDFTRSLSEFLKILWMSPVLIFAFTACLGRGQGFHWLLFVLPFFVMWVGLKLNESDLERFTKILGGFTGFLSLAILIVLVAPEKTIGSFFENRFQFEFAQINHREEMMDAIMPDVKSADGIFTEGYTFSSILNFDLKSYASKHHLKISDVSVWGSGSRFGRAFDWTENFSALDGKKLVIITPGPFSINFWAHYFTSLTSEKKTVAGKNFYISTGIGFKSNDYLKQEFKRPVETYYHFRQGCSLWTLTHDAAF
jgi:hypothetical protein